MREGHPYLTEKLDEQRARQRRTLRSIPSALLQSGVPRIPAVDEIDRGIAETELRGLADVELEALAELLKQCAEIGIEEALVTQRILAAGAPMRPPPYPFLEVRREAETRSMGQLPREISQTDELALIRLVSLLAWADDIAGDYADTRIRRTGSD